MLDEDNRIRDPLISSYSEYSEKMVNFGNSHYSNSYKSIMNVEDNKYYPNRFSEYESLNNSDVYKKKQ